MVESGEEPSGGMFAGRSLIFDFGSPMQAGLSASQHHGRCNRLARCERVLPRRRKTFPACAIPVSPEGVRRDRHRPMSTLARGRSRKLESIRSRQLLQLAAGLFRCELSARLPLFLIWRRFLFRRGGRLRSLSGSPRQAPAKINLIEPFRFGRPGAITL